MLKLNRIEHRCVALVLFFLLCSEGVCVCVCLSVFVRVCVSSSWEEAVLHSLCFSAQIVLRPDVRDVKDVRSRLVEAA